MVWGLLLDRSPRSLQTCKKWIDENDFPVRPLTPARKAKLEKEKRRRKSRKK